MSTRLFTKKKVLSVGLAMVIAGSAAVATAGPHYFKEHGMKHKIEKMLKRLDLSDEQEVQIEQILVPMKEARKERRGFPRMRAMMALDPESTDYMAQVEEQATAASEEVKERIIKMATIRQEVHAVLTEDQKAELKAMFEKKMKRMDEHWGDED